MKKRALLSVYNKDGIVTLASFLIQAGWELVSTGGTARCLQENKIPVIEVSQLTGFPECLDGRVKTLHPAIHAGLLAKRSSQEHLRTLEAQHIDLIDLVCVNLYPFFDSVQALLSLEQTIEFIDIGGPTMLRSSAKNFAAVIVLSDPADYNEAIQRISADTLTPDFRKRLAGKVFNLTAAYDAAISRYLLDEPYPHYWALSLKKGQPLRYGENGHQSAALYMNTGSPGSLGTMEQLHGKELGYNNIRDVDIAWKAACAFGLYPQGLSGKPLAAPLGAAELQQYVPAFVQRPQAACVAVKHNTPCGIALGAALLDAYQKTYTADPVSIFGGIVASNVPVDVQTAALLSELFLEIIIAPDFEPAAFALLSKKKNIRLIKGHKAPREETEAVSIDGGLLVQERDDTLLSQWAVVTKAAPLPEHIADMVFGLRAVAWIKSNAIVVVKGQAAVGIGGGQTNRIWAAQQALDHSAHATACTNGSFAGEGAQVLASDAFFPLPDVVEAAARAGIKAIIQPGGSLKDHESIEACDRLGLAMVFTGTRHFKH
ncbi:bifunctional phosphoribosylaminoimidazolecarboxamide formyltransferase/IMP cyclohydrolase [Breznakiellaceae bacterium SP9]